MDLVRHFLLRIPSSPNPDQPSVNVFATKPQSKRRGPWEGTLWLGCPCSRPCLPAIVHLGREAAGSHGPCRVRGIAQASGPSGYYGKAWSAQRRGLRP